MSAPHVSGVLALLLAADPTLTPEDLRAAIRASAQDLGAPGHDRVYGAGRVSAAAAIRAGRPLDLRGRIDAPLPGDTIDDTSAEHIVLGAIEGRDVALVSLELGAGNEPVEWSPLPLLAEFPSDSAESGALALLPVSELADGPWVLRLTLGASDGTSVQEFTPFSVDRNVPVFVSSAEHKAEAPDVHGRRVVWQSRRPTDLEGETQLDLFAGVFGRTGERALVTEPGDQFDAVLSESALAWRSFVSETLERVVGACRFDGLRGRCQPFDAYQGDTEPRLSGRRLVFAGTLGGLVSLISCQIERRTCPGVPLAPEIASSRAPVIDGLRLVWASSARGAGMFSCLLGPEAACDPEPLFGSAQLLGPIAISEPWLALLGFASGGPGIALYACEMDLVSAFCDAREIASFPTRLTPSADLSDGRLVWHAAGAHGQPDVFFCELGPGASCEPRALTNDPASQTYPRIDGTHVVWLDDRDGITRVVSFELPASAPPPGHGGGHRGRGRTK
jgi:beta propeller repeat protein